MATDRALHWTYLGRVPYREALELQLRVREALRAGVGPERLLLLEHPPVFTLGRNASRSDLLWPEEFLRRFGIEVFETDRGGKATYHGPGQLVGYPIVDLSPDRRDVRRYVQDLGSALVTLLFALGLQAEMRLGDELGVWIDRRKIASIGIHLSRWRTTHGFALNVAPELWHFTGIVPCGLAGIEMTSVARERPGLPLPSLGELAARVAPLVAERLGRRAHAEPGLALLASIR